MVKILASGEIVPDDDPRVAGGSESGRPRSAMPRHRQGGIHQVNNQGQEPVQHMPDGSIFDSLNQRLLDMGLPRWNIGSHVVEPIVTVGFILAFILMGFNGLLFAAILFFISKTSLGGGGPGQGFRGWLGGGGGGAQGQGDGGTGENRRGDSSRRPPRGGGGGGGYTLGRS